MKRVYLSLLALIIVCLAGSSVGLVQSQNPAEDLTVASAPVSTALVEVNPAPAPFFRTVLDDLQTNAICSGQPCSSSSQCDSVSGYTKICLYGECCYRRN